MTESSISTQSQSLKDESLNATQQFSHSFTKVKFTDSIICMGDKVQISYYPQEKTNSTKVNLILPEKQISNFSGSTSIKFNQAGTFTIVIIYEKDNQFVKEFQRIYVQLNPTASFSFDNTKDLEVTFRNSSTNISKCNWEFGDGFSSTTFHPIHSYKKSGNYSVNLVVENRYGCKDETTSEISVNAKNEKSAIEIPNYFSPDGDGKNDYYYLTIEDIEFFELEITDRYGTSIFKSKNIDEKWDGNNKFTGQECVAGSYFYFLTYKIIGSETIKKTGSILLIRN